MTKMTFEEWWENEGRKYFDTKDACRCLWDAVEKELSALERDQSAREAAARKAAERVKQTRTAVLQKHGVPISQEFVDFVTAIGELIDVQTSGTSALDDLLQEARREAGEVAIAEMNRYWESDDPDARHLETVDEAMSRAVSELRSAPRTEGKCAEANPKP